ncbi:ectoine/hydroxyectoine ABC transporter permease subunit EhuD [Prauserella sp. PE36]|uniref:Ectoine/hydroxyectoine ABC transporter permease subunit EhuD n=1 Tax=Prauserella endophytica TaxID=1592324 RepID=A0ABY2RZC2_9PSEU|nr:MULTISPECIES: ectoine/hydroxyectoine ABC transporter permease subunit EhuD [Prauserella]PXY26776.1 ectoine/hydroxyectoine ABC transporter permease subunit EhuD [Prauserella coralliicola]RBM16584.1 ectoine/hydroxyectoine ABC transporter permease subunit EhuD [Prauserella sp. PE36]TKG66178.1 ectoine/hydroxyectoine ABC transporter permease subunit EhuD [Prauserella endophytica]
MNFEWSGVWDAMPTMLDGLLVALAATGIGYVIALVLGLVFAFLRRSDNRWVSMPVGFLVEFIRSTPLLVQLFFFFYVLPLIGISASPLATGAFALGLHYATYTSEVYRSGIDGVPPGQWEAATALNLSTRRTWTNVILPQAIPRVVPALGNYVIAMFKDTPQLLAITVVEMLGGAIAIGSETFRYSEPIAAAGLVYLVVALLMAWVARVVERRYGQVRV